MSDEQSAAAEAAGSDLLRDLTRPQARVISIVAEGELIELEEVLAGISHRLPVSVTRGEAHDLALAILSCWSPRTPAALTKLAMALLLAERAQASIGDGGGVLQ